jgi:hypothetical protein
MDVCSILACRVRRAAMENKHAASRIRVVEFDLGGHMEQRNRENVWNPKSEKNTLPRIIGTGF